MALNQGDIEQLICSAIDNAQVTLSDLRGDGAHFAAYIVSPAFAGKTRIEQHRMVYKALEDKMGDEIESIAIQTAVPEVVD